MALAAWHLYFIEKASSIYREGDYDKLELQCPPTPKLVTFMFKELLRGLRQMNALSRIIRNNLLWDLRC